MVWYGMSSDYMYVATPGGHLGSPCRFPMLLRRTFKTRTTFESKDDKTNQEHYDEKGVI